jgi:hypothetical protein
MRESYAQTQVPTQGKDAVPYATWLEIANKLLRNGVEAFFGTVAGTGGALDVDTPFDPAAVLIYNETNDALFLFLPSMDAAKAVEIAAVATQAQVVVAIAANGITLGVKKFTLGTNADLNTAADVIHYMALGARDVGGSL